MPVYVDRKRHVPALFSNISQGFFFFLQNVLPICSFFLELCHSFVDEVMIDHRRYTHNLSSCEIKAWKKFRIRTQDLCVTRTVTYQTIWELVTLTASSCFSEVQKYDLSYIHFHSSPSMGILRTHDATSPQLRNFFRSQLQLQLTTRALHLTGFFR